MNEGERQCERLSAYIEFKELKWKNGRVRKSKKINLKRARETKKFMLILFLIYKQIGNAVPVRLALAVAEPIAEFAKKELQGK